MKTSHISVLVLLLVTALGSFGCRSVEDYEVTPYEAGRDVTVLYLLSKNSLKESEREGIVTAYQVFDATMKTIEDENLEGFKGLLLDELQDEILGDNPTEEDEETFLYAKIFVNRAWVHFTQHIEWDSVQEEQSYKQLKEFHRGINDALVDYGLRDPDYEDSSD